MKGVDRRGSRFGATSNLIMPRARAGCPVLYCVLAGDATFWSEVRVYFAKKKLTEKGQLIKAKKDEYTAVHTYIPVHGMMRGALSALCYAFMLL